MFHLDPFMQSMVSYKSCVTNHNLFEQSLQTCHRKPVPQYRHCICLSVGPISHNALLCLFPLFIRILQELFILRILPLYHLSVKPVDCDTQLCPVHVGIKLSGCICPLPSRGTVVWGYTVVLTFPIHGSSTFHLRPMVTPFTDRHGNECKVRRRPVLCLFRNIYLT